MYLASLGIENYMPRVHLPFAPQSHRCEFIVPEVYMLPADSGAIALSNNGSNSPQKIEVIESSPLIPSRVSELLESKSSTAPSTVAKSASDILALLNDKPKVIEGFNLSVWRPFPNTMVIDSRNTKLALPTESFLQNILAAIKSAEPMSLREEVLRWPMVENSFAKRTAADARVELQTWLSVQHEIHSLKYLWLMGANATNYFLPANQNYLDSLFKTVKLEFASVEAVILPSLNEILKAPLTKRDVYSTIAKYQRA